MDWTDVPEASIREILRQGEATLEGTLTIGIGADQRATTMCGIFGGGAIALFAAAATIVAGPQPSQPLLWSSLVTAIILFVASLICGWAALPGDFHAPGYEPKRLLSAAKDELALLTGTVEDVQARIDFNRRSLERSAKLVRIGFYVALAAIIAGGAIFLVLRFCVPGAPLPS